MISLTVHVPAGSLIRWLLAVLAAAFGAMAVLAAIPAPSTPWRRLLSAERRASSDPGTGPARRLRTIPGKRTVLANGRAGPAGARAPLGRLLGPRSGAWSVRIRLPMAVAVGVLASTVGLGARLPAVGGAMVGVVLAGVSFVIAGKLEPSGVRHRRLRMTVDLPNTLELIAAALRAGLPLRAAVAAVSPLVGGPLGEDLSGVLRAVDLGVPEADAWRALRAHPVLGPLALDLARSVDSGTRLAETLRHHARESRHRRRGALEARAKSVGVHSVPPLMVCFLPAFLLIGVVPTGVSVFLHALG